MTLGIKSVFTDFKLMIMDKEIFKKVATEFFYHWWNAEGNNTSEGFDKWWEDKGQELVKNCSIPDVSHQRELLLAFTNHLLKSGEMGDLDISNVDDFLKINKNYE